jgi:hypothetical protein
MLATLIVAVTSLPAYAWNSVEGGGARSCAQFAKDYQEHPEETETAYFEWAEGYISGLNVWVVSTNLPRRDVSSMSISDQEALLRTYCNEHPLASYSAGAIEIFNRLTKIPDPK